MKHNDSLRPILFTLCILITNTQDTLGEQTADQPLQQSRQNAESATGRNTPHPFLSAPHDTIVVGMGCVGRTSFEDYFVVLTDANQTLQVIKAALQRGTQIPPADLGCPAIVRALVEKTERGETKLQLISVDGVVHEQERDAILKLRKLGAEIKRNKQGWVYSVSLGGKERRDGSREPLTAQELQHLKPLKELTSLFLADVTDDGLLELSSHMKLEFVQLSSERLTSAGLKGLSQSKNMGVLNLKLPNLTDPGLAHFSEFRSLYCLRINGSKVTSKGLVHLQKLTRLQILELNDTKVGDDGLKHLSELSQLNQLHLEGTRITDGALARMADLKKLWALNLSRTAVSDLGLENFREFASLQGVKYLYLERTKVTDAGLAHLVDMKHLEGLHLDGNKITDAGLAHLHSHTLMKWVNVRGGRVSEAAVTRVSQGKPRGFYVGRDRPR